MATRSDLDALVVQVEGLDLEENKAGSGAYGCVFRVTVNGRDCIAKKLHHILRHAACMVVFVYSADSMVECVYCHLCVSLVPRPLFFEGGKAWCPLLGY